MAKHKSSGRREVKMLVTVSMRKGLNDHMTDAAIRSAVREAIKFRTVFGANPDVLNMTMHATVKEAVLMERYEFGQGHGCERYSVTTHPNGKRRPLMIRGLPVK